MTVTQKASPTHKVAVAPLWLPRHDMQVVDQAAARPPDVVQGYGFLSRLATLFLGSPAKIVMSAASVVTLVAFLAILPTTFGAGIGGLLQTSLYQAWTVALMLLVSVHVRSVGVGATVRYWLAGMFTVTIAASALAEPLADLVSPSEVWVRPILDELLKTLPLIVAVIAGRRFWRHPGLSDLMLLGFAVGGGYAFHSSGLWERTSLSGLDTNAGFLVPTIYQEDGLFVVGHAVWTSLIGLAIGLLLLHRRQPLAIVGAIFTMFVVVADHMSINDADGMLGWARQLLFNGKLVALVFFAGIAAAVALDHHRQSATGARDHLFPSDRSHSSRPTDMDDEDLLQPMLVRRYRRMRNGVHNTVDASAVQWPPMSQTSPAPIAQLARLGRAADVAVGPGTSSRGWALDPETADGFRFVGPNGFTNYVAGEEQASETDTVSFERRRDFLQFFGLGVVAIALFVFVRLLTAGDPSEAVIGVSLGLPDAANSPPLIRGLLGAVAAAVAIVGRGHGRLGEGTEVGPSDDPRPDHSDECEA